MDCCRKKPVPRDDHHFINQKDDELNKNGYIIAQGSSILQGISDEKPDAVTEAEIGCNMMSQVP